MPKFQVLDAESWMMDTPVYSSDQKLIGRLCWVTTSSEKDAEGGYEVQYAVVNSHSTYLKVPAATIAATADFRVALNISYDDVQQLPECELPDSAAVASTLVQGEASLYSKRSTTRPMHSPMHRRSQRNA